MIGCCTVPPFRRLIRTATYWALTVAAMVCGITVTGRAQTFSLRYIVTVEDPRSGQALVRWELAGVDEIDHLVLRFRGAQPLEIKASGTVTELDHRLVWRPAKPYAHFAYRMPMNSVRGHQQRYESYLSDRWFVTRARQLFPLVAVQYATGTNNLGPSTELRSRATLVFQVPRGWKCVAPYSARETHQFELRGSRSFLTPRGWFACGKLATEAREIGGVWIELAQVSTAARDPEEVFTFLEATFPVLQRLLPPAPSRILVVVAPDPMWHGGISGEGSVFLHARRPLRDPDKTSPYLHELFHVLQPFKPAPDADWFVEGLAEYYSLEIQRRAGILDDRAFAKGLRSFARYGRWNVDLRQQQDNAATNNSAPLVLYALDQRIQRLTAGKSRLDDVLPLLAAHKGRVDTRTFQAAAERVAGTSLESFFARHVISGEAPDPRRVP